MAHRPEDMERQTSPDTPGTVTVHLADVEPFAGLCAAVARFCGALTPDVYSAMPPAAVEALGDVQGIMWRLEHSSPERR